MISNLHKKTLVFGFIAENYREFIEKTMIESLKVRMQQQLDERKSKGNFRKLSLDSDGIDFYSNDYLGLAKNDELIKKIENNFQLLPPKEKRLGATGSRLLSGNSSLALELEQKLAQVFEGEACLLFNSGFAANTSLVATIAQAKDAVLYDELIHASLKEGCRLSMAKYQWSFKHNEISALEKKINLAKSKGAEQIYVLVESVYSMDGDMAPLEELTKICLKTEAHLIVDEAHSTGLWGKNGNGLCCELGLQHQIFARVYTFGKAIGCHGACVVGTQLLKEYLVNFARGFIYTTALPPHGLVSVSQSFEWIAHHPELKEKLFKNIEHYHQCLEKYDFQENTFQKTPIQIFPVSGNENCRKLANSLITSGLEVRPIFSPTVPLGKERLRICLHTYNTFEEVERLVEKITAYISRI
ncbi:MAG: pyridoxal phosphate-dependent aminotransferase family protein [Flammeovirgaceae bacterium]